MKIGIIVAMRKELDLLLPLLHDSEESRMSGFEFHSGKMGRHDVMVMQCGIGKVNAAMGTLMLINHFSPNYVINSGVAGGADNAVNVMDVVAGARVAYHDVWCGPESELGRVQGLPLYFEGALRLLDLLPDRENIPPESKKLIQTKLSQLITDNGIADNDSFNRFVLTAKVIVISKDIVAGPPQRISQKIDVTLMIGDVIEDKVYESVTIPVLGIGQSEEKAFMAAFKNIKPSNNELRAFMERGKEKKLEDWTQ